MRCCTVWRVVLPGLAVVLLSGQWAFGQESRGSILGRVMDSSGAVVVGAKVQATNVATNTVGSSVTNESGNFEIPYLLPGVYRVTVEMPGFKTAVREGIELRVSDRLALDFTLQVGDVAEAVVVRGETPLLETTSASAGAVMYEQMVQNLPLVGGGPFYLTRYTPGVLVAAGHSAGNPSDLSSATDMIIHGTKDASEASVDGSPNMAQRAAPFSPPQDLVQEFRISTASYDASIGHAAGAVTNVSIKSGTNEVHGTGYGFDSEWRATPWFANYFIYDPTTGPITPEKKAAMTPGWLHRRWGATVTAPWVIPKLYNGKNRTFWSFGYEGLRINRQVSDTYTVPSQAEKQGDLSELLQAGSRYQIYDPFTTTPAATKGRFQRQPLPGNLIPKSRLDPIALKILSYYPDPNRPGTIDGRNNYQRTHGALKWNRTLVNRVDHVISDKQRMFVRWNNAQYDQADDTLPTPATKTQVDRTAWGLALDDVYVFNPQLLLNLRYSLTYQNPYNYRATQGFDLTTLGFSRSLMEEIRTKNSPAGLTFPQVQIDGSAYTDLGTNGGSDVKVYYHNFGFTVTKMLGGHSMKFGGEYRLMRENGINYGNVAPQLVFGQTYTRGPLDNSPTAPIGQGLASMLLGIPTGGRININASRAEQSTFWAGYIHDDWRVTRRFTVNIGLRYEYEGPTTERFNRSIRGFDFNVESPIAAQAKANYAKNPIPEIPVNQFQVMGGLLFAGDRGQPRELWRADKNNLAPRVGIAYELTSKTVIRAGYGIFYDVVGIDRQDVNQGGFNQTTNIVASIDNGQTYQASLSNPFPSGLKLPAGASAGLATFLGQGVSFFNEKQLNPYMQRWSFSVQRQLPGRVLFETSYVGNRGTKLTANRQFTATPETYLSKLPYRDQATIDYLSQQVANPFYGIPEFAGTGLGNVNISRGNLLKPYPHFSSITADLNNGYSWFHSMETRVEKRMSAGLTFQAAWTYSKWMEATAYLNDTDLRPEEVISENDFTHRLVVNGIYELPLGRRKALFSSARGFWQGLLGGWQVQGLYEGQTGKALGFGNAIFNGDLHNIELPVSRRRVERWFNTDAGFERDSSKVLGWNVRRFPSRFNGVRRDGINNFDLSVFKNFEIRERFKFQFQFLSFNAMNHPQFDVPNTNPTSSTFGVVTSELGHGQRQVTLGLKLLF